MPIKFIDKEISKLDIRIPDNFYKLFVKDLCGERYYSELTAIPNDVENDIPPIIKKILKDQINWEQFNEILLLFNQDRISKDFFDIFFTNKVNKQGVGLKGLKQGIILFRGFALLCFGDFRFAFKQLSQKNRAEIEQILGQYCDDTFKLIKTFKKKPTKVLRINPVPGDKTWLTGYLSIEELDRKKRLAEALSGDDQEKVLSALEKLKGERESIKQVALRNTDIYLTWDYMDIYIATSMRYPWEYEETHNFVNELFKSRKLKKLKLRYFDPTQSTCEERIDKGLIEGLMLKRARCTIYMAQETDTMGKDSELASTLAQKKPVIAYVPHVNINKYAKKFFRFPLKYFKIRLSSLQANEIFENKKCNKDLLNFEIKYDKIIDDFLDELKKLPKYDGVTPEEKEAAFKEKNRSLFTKVCKIISIAEHHSYNNRASMFTSFHPLAVQIHLESGVANGVLVAREIKDIKELLYRILTNDLEFTFEYEKNVTKLIEKISGCPFRLYTHNEKLANSFWNFYLLSEQQNHIL